MEILDLPFTDLFVAKRPEDCWLSHATGGDSVLPESLYSEASSLRAFLSEERFRAKAPNFRIKWGIARQDFFRVRPQITAFEDPLYMCRRLLPGALPMDKTGVPKAVITILREQIPAAGLILVAGPMGAGKTTVASSFCVDHIARTGVIGMTVEAPAEINIEGRHGDKGGRIYQTMIAEEAEKPEVLRGLLRSGAKLIFDGEISTAESARACVNLAATGLLVVATIHGTDAVSTIERIAAMAANNIELSRAFIGVIHLTLRPIPPEMSEFAKLGPATRPLSVSSLMAVGEAEVQIKNHIAAGAWSALDDELDRQRRRLLHGGTL